MHVIAIYNNKGGVGKSTLAVFMADFLASVPVRGRTLRVVVIDGDPQGSASVALLGKTACDRAKENAHTLGALASALGAGRTPVLEEHLLRRSGHPPQGRRRPVAPLSVILSAKICSFAFEANPLHPPTLLKERLRPELGQRFDLALIDLPGNIDSRHLLSVNLLTMSDAVITPLEVSRFSLEAMPDTLEMLEQARLMGDGTHPVLLGMLLNRVDKRGQQYQRNLPEILTLAERLNIPLFAHTLPHAQGLTSATEMEDPNASDALRERYGSYYPHVKAVVGEAFQRWYALAAPSEAP